MICKFTFFRIYLYYAPEIFHRNTEKFARCRISRGRGEAMKNVPILLICSALVISLIPGCDLLDISGKAEKNLIYPLQEGNLWEYEREGSVYNFRLIDNPDSVIESREFTIRAHSTVRSNGMVKLSEFSNIPGAVIELEQIYSEEGMSHELKSWNYYTYMDDGLYSLGYRSASGASVMPKVIANEQETGTGFYIKFDGKYFTSIRALTEYVEFIVQLQYDDPDDIIIEDRPLKVIPRYMNTGRQWTFRTKGNPWRIDKRILGKEIIEVPAGQFECYKVQWLIDLGDTGEWDERLLYYDYISDKGLIKRELYFKDQHWTPYPSPDQKGYFDMSDISVLKELDVNF